MQQDDSDHNNAVLPVLAGWQQQPVRTAPRWQQAAVRGAVRTAALRQAVCKAAGVRSLLPGRLQRALPALSAPTRLAVQARNASRNHSEVLVH